MEFPPNPISFGRRIANLAAEHPDRPAIVLTKVDGSEQTVRWAELDAESNRTARLLADRGVDEHRLVVVALPIGIGHFLAVIGAWRLGATVLPLNSGLPASELGQLLEVADAWRPAAIVGDLPIGLPEGVTKRAVVPAADLPGRITFAADPLPDRIAQPARALASGGSTGRPKLILDPNPAVVPPGKGHFASRYGLEPGDPMLITTRLYHAVAYNSWRGGLADDLTIVVMEHFEAKQALDLIERHRIAFLGTVPTVLQRLLREPDIRERDLTSIKGMYHTGGPCPPWVKRGWLELIPPERVHELYGGAEATGLVSITGDEWLTHEGSVGRGLDCEVRVLDDLGADVPPGTIGEIYQRPLSWTQARTRYLGDDTVKSTPDGFVSIGDLGWLDNDGYLYLADRRVDLILSGAANVYPAEVEAALSEHPEVTDVAVVGLPDPEWGQRVHAVIQPRDPDHPPSIESLDRFVRDRLQAYKVPRSYAFVAQLPRDANGKIRRSGLKAEG